MREHSILIHIADGIYGYGAIKLIDLDKLIKIDNCEVFNAIMSENTAQSEKIKKVNKYLKSKGLSEFVLFSTKNINYFIKQLLKGSKYIRGWSCTKL